MPRVASPGGSWEQPGWGPEGLSNPPADRGPRLGDPPIHQTGTEPGADGPFWVPGRVQPPVCGHAWDCLAQGLGTWGSVSRREKPACPQAPAEPGKPL